ncbi:putative HAD superfamily hydrolase [Aureobasidium sp. EXF-8846]|nr:putative HAD superfamily hydrolase [Aureobasidium sp. EXF-8846]
MDSTLRCNSLKCRQRLADRAVVTTCSHIFCVPCSNALGLSSSADGVRVCPACDAQLANPDDAVATQLNPTEDYKTSYSGRVPTNKPDESSMYHDYMAKNLADRYANLNSQMDNVIKDANSEISGLRDRLERMHVEKKTLEQKNQELVKAFSEKSKAHQRLTKLYQQAKGTQDAQQMRYAAADDVDQVIQSMQGPGFGETLRDRTPQRPASMAGRGGRQELPRHARIGSFGGSKDRIWSSQNSRGGPDSSQVMDSPSLGPGMQNYGMRVSTSGQRQATPNRQPLGELHRNATSSQRFGGYGSGSGGGVKESNYNVASNEPVRRPLCVPQCLTDARQRPPAIRACLFDMDGLLIDSEDLYTVCTNETLRKYGKPDLPWNIKAQLQGRPGPEAGKIFHDWAQLPITREDFLQQTSLLQQKYFPSTQPLPGVRDLLKTLDANPNVHIALATSSNKNNFGLKTAHLEDMFDVFEQQHRILGDDPRIPSGKGKPAPDIYLLALETINARIRKQGKEKEITPAECLVFEDSVPGVESGRRAGMQVVWCPHPGLLKEYKGREDEVLAGTSIMKQYGVSSGGSEVPGKVGDGWARLHMTLEQFPYKSYGMEA